MAASGSKSTVGALEASLDRKLQAVTNTMESIQSLSSWCIENKKHHATIVHYWIKWLRRSGVPHRLNLFYLANDVIQNCKRKNAIVYRETFGEVLTEAASLVRDPSISKSIERIFKIWEERNVYQRDTITSFKSALSGGWNKRERNKSVRPKAVEKVVEAPPVNPKAALKSKIVAEFRPQILIDDLLTYKRSLDHVDLKEKQLSNMRVDVCSTETLKRLKDKAGGKKFSKDFEEASAKLEEFVNILDKQVKSGPALTDALENAGIFYEAQYKEVKIVVNAYKTFANRVGNLKKKLDQLKATLPDPEESPVPSPTIDAPSPTGSESPFQGMGAESPLSPEVEITQPSSPDPPKDNRDVEDMELSDVDADEEMPKIIVEERSEHAVSPSSMIGTDSASTASTTVISPPTQTTASALIPSSITISTHVPVSSNISVPVPTTSTPAKTVNTSTITPSIPLALPNLANVDLGKISSILSSLTSVMKTTAVSPAAKPSPGTPTTPTTNLSGSLKTPVQGAPNTLANILSKVEITPESILSVLSKSQGPTTPSMQGLSLFQNATENTVVSSAAVTNSNSTASNNSTVSTIKENDSSSDTPPYASKNFAYSPATSSSEVPSSSVFNTTAETSSNLKQTVSPLEFSSQSVQSTENTMTQLSELSKPNDEAQPSSLEMKIHNFLKGNPGFSGLDLNIPILSGLGANAAAETPEFNRGPPISTLDNVDGTPVRDERSGTPTQDEIMDKPSSSNVDTLSLISKIVSPGSSTPSSTRSPILNKDSDFQKPGSMPSYRSFGLTGNSPNAYIQSTETMDKTPSFIDSPISKFYPETTFQEDGDYRDFDYSVPPPTTSVSLENNPTKSILKSNQGLGASEYQPNISGFSQSQDFGRHSFPSSMQASFNPGEASDQLSPSSEMFGMYSLMGGDMEPSRSSPSKGDLFFPPDNINHSLSLLHSGVSQSQYQESPHSHQTQSLNFSTKTNVPDLPQGLGNWKEEQPLCSTVSVSSTIEFKNMLKNASRRPSDENHFSQTNTDNLNEEVKVSALDSTQISSEEQQQQEEHFRIETRVSSDCADLPDNKEEKGAPIESLGYHNSGNINLSGEPIKTVESMRVGNRGHGRGGSRVGWFEIGSTGSSFDDLSGGSEQTSVSTSSSRVGFETPPEELLPRYSDTVSDFRGNKMQSFEHRLPPPPIVASMERSGNFPNEQTGPPPGPPPNLPPDHGSLFPRDHPVPSHMNSVEPPNSLTHGSRSRPMDHGGTPFPMHPPPDLGGIPFSPQSVDIRNPFSQDHNIIHQGSMREHFGLLPVPARDHGVSSIDHNGPPLGRVNETLSLHSRDPHSSHGAPPPPLIAHHHRDNTNRGGFRQPRPNFRPREPYHNLKRPRPPFGRGPHFFAPKRPFYPPRY